MSQCAEGQANYSPAFQCDEGGLLVAQPLIHAIKSGQDMADTWPVDREAAMRWVYVTAFEANVPGQGYGRTSLSLLCEVCDRARATIVLDATAYAPGLSQVELVAFYERYGFRRWMVMADGLDRPMVREPK